MERQQVQSEMIRAIGYDKATQVLEIEFHRQNRVYRYFAVPPFLYEGMMISRSKGKFFTDKIAERYRAEQVF